MKWSSFRYISVHYVVHAPHLCGLEMDMSSTFIICYLFLMHQYMATSLQSPILFCVCIHHCIFTHVWCGYIAIFNPIFVNITLSVD